jgi:hypothetical protein
MRAEHVHQTASRKRFDDEHVRRRRIGVERDLLRRAFELPESVGESIRITGDLRSAGVRIELARARNRRLHEHRSDRRDDDRREQGKWVRASAFVTPAAAAAEERRKLRHPRHHHDRGGDRGCHRADENVAMFDVRQFVRNHPFELVIRHQTQNAFGGGDRGMTRITAGGERVR